MRDIKKKIEKLPNDPGVYLFKNKKGEILYIGRATSLKDRVKSYYSEDLEENRGPIIKEMISRVSDISFEGTDSVLEAVLREAYLIKKYQPSFNSREKDNKSFNYVVITKEEYPRVLMVRHRELIKKSDEFSSKWIFGPFPSGGILRRALKIIRKIIPFRDKCRAILPSFEENLKSKPCFNYQLGLCPGVCAGIISPEDYQENIKQIKFLFEGRKRELVRKLKKEMKKYSNKKDFEKAGEIRDRIFALDHIKDISLISDSHYDIFGRGVNSLRIEGYDIAHTSGSSSVGVMVVLEGGELKKSDYRKFRIKSALRSDDTGSLAEVIKRRLGHLDWPLPDLMVIDGGVAQKNTAERVITSWGFSIPVISVVKDKNHRPHRYLGDKTTISNYKKEIVEINQEAHRFAIKYHKSLRDKIN